MIYLFLISLYFTIIQPTFAATPTPIPTDTPTSVDTITPSTTDEIQKIREVVQQKVKEKLKQITSPSSSQKGIVGKVLQLDASSLTIEYQNSSKTVSLTSDTVFVDAKRNKSKLENLKVGQDILIMGISDSGNKTFDAKRIVFIDLKTIMTPRTVVIGKIVDVSKTTSVFTLIPSKNKNGLYQIKTDIKTEINDKQDQKLKITDLKSGQKIIAVLVPDAKVSKTYNAVKIINLTEKTEITTTVTPTPTKKP